ncbi:MAG TPA: penicillin-binding transpeptidase domain-containing protein [Blastocatellia bacterium]|nr:penicillin-binding transpeptidase domain-containing protein [Blastocatellia bacterium]
MCVSAPFKLMVVFGLIALAVNSPFAHRHSIFASFLQSQSSVRSVSTVRRDLGKLAYDSLENHAGVIIIVDPRYARILRRVSRGTDVRFSSNPFELTQVFTAYTALDAGIIREQTRLDCDSSGKQVAVVEALANSCPTFFAELSKRISPRAFKRSAERLGFTYYNIEAREASSRTKPVTIPIPTTLTAEAFQVMAAQGTGLTAEDLHFAQMASSWASGITANEILANYLLTTSQAVVPVTNPINRKAWSIVQRGLVNAVDYGAAKMAANIDHKVAGKMGGDGQTAIFISYAPANAPEIALVVYLKEAQPRDAAKVAGIFYRSYFGSF